MASNFEDCVGRVAAKGGVAAREAEDILQQVSDRADAMKSDGEADPYGRAAQDLAAMAKQRARDARLDAVLNATKRNAVMAEVEKQGGIRNAVTTLRSLLHGTNVGTRDNIESQWKGLSSRWQAVLAQKLHAAGLEKVATSGDLDSDIAQELWALNAGLPSPKPSSPAAAIAKIIHPMLDDARNRLNAAGARIGDAADYVSHTVHSPEKMRAAAGPKMTPDQAFAAWWKVTEPLLAEKTFETVIPEEGQSAQAARARFGRSVFDALVSGIHMTPEGAFGLPTDTKGYVPPAFEGSYNIARKVSQPRVLFWKDGVAWDSYMKQFGVPNSLTAGVMMTLDKSARQIALMEKLGTNPSANFEMVLRRIQETYRDDLNGLAGFKTRIAGLQNVMAHLDGRANIPVNAMAARISSNVRTLESMGSLGGVGVTHFASIWPTVTSEMTHHGVGRLETMGNLVKAMVRGRGSAERQAILAEMGAYAHGLTRDMFARWQPEDTIPGRISSLANVFMKYTGIHYIFDNTQAAIREMLANNLARQADRPFDQLEPHVANMIGKYGIGEGEWDLLRQVGDLPTSDGYRYITPQEAMRVDPANVEALLRERGQIPEGATPEAIAKQVEQFRQGLADKMLSYYNDAAAHGVVTAGVRERAMVLGQERPGTFGGELRRFLLQFKMWPLAAMNQVIGREIHVSLSGKEAAWNLGILAALSMAGGYLRMSVNDAALGRPIRNPLDHNTMLAALAQGGGVGILGDFLFGEVNRFGGGIVGTLGGPVIGDADQLIKLYGRWRKGEAGWPDLAHFAVRHIPFANLVYLKGALDYMMFYHLYEAASPGWWQRTNQRLIKEQGRGMVGYTPGGSIPWTPWGLGSQ